MSEKCQRCNKTGDDRRTLWMACFYDMDELGLPFKDYQMKGKFMVKGGTEDNSIVGPIQIWNDDPDAVEQKKHLYTLRVCKSCRGDWMHAIKDWFHADCDGDDEADGYEEPDETPKAYIRDLGKLRSMTDEEIAEMRAQGREPIFMP